MKIGGKNNTQAISSQVSGGTSSNFGKREVEQSKSNSIYFLKLVSDSWNLTIGISEEIAVLCKKVAPIGNRIVEWGVEGLDSYKSELYRLINPYHQMYLIDIYMGPIVSKLLPTCPPLLRFTVQALLAHPQLVYFNRLKEEGVLDKIWNGELSFLKEFFVREFRSIFAPETRIKIAFTLVMALKCAFIGPFLAYLGARFLSETCGPLVTTIMVSIAKGILSYIIFQNIHDFPVILIPTILIAGTIRGVIYFRAAEIFKDLRFEGGDTFYLATGVRQTFEPAVKRLEKTDISQFLLRNFPMLVAVVWVLIMQ